MMGQSWTDWITQSVSDPRAVARQLMAFAFSKEQMWTALVALCALNAVLFSLPFALDPASNASLPPVMRQPFIFAFASFASAAITVFGLYWTGRAMGGGGTLEDMLVVMVWLQFLQVALQAIVLLMTFILPAVAGLIGLLALPLGLWICVNFVDCVHGFDSLLKALAVMILWVVGLVLGLSMLLALLGVSAAGVNGYV